MMKIGMSWGLVVLVTAGLGLAQETPKKTKAAPGVEDAPPVQRGKAGIEWVTPSIVIKAGVCLLIEGSDRLRSFAAWAGRRLAAIRPRANSPACRTRAKPR